MVQAMINIPERTNRVLNIVKAKHGLRDKSSAIALVVAEYEEAFLEPELKPEFIKEMKKIEKEIKEGKVTRYSSIEEARRDIENG